MCHVVRVYLHTFPEILKDIDKNLKFREVVELRKDDQIFGHIVEIEVKAFGFKKFEDKIKYFDKHLFISDESIWIDEGQELWKEIDETRHAIIHDDQLPEVSYEFLLKTVNYVQRAMLAICVTAQSRQGVPFKWASFSEFIKKRSPPKLRGTSTTE